MELAICRELRPWMEANRSHHNPAIELSQSTISVQNTPINHPNQSNPNNNNGNLGKSKKTSKPGKNVNTNTNTNANTNANVNAISQGHPHPNSITPNSNSTTTVSGRSILHTQPTNSSSYYPQQSSAILSTASAASASASVPPPPPHSMAAQPFFFQPTMMTSTATTMMNGIPSHIPTTLPNGTTILAPVQLCQGRLVPFVNGLSPYTPSVPLTVQNGTPVYPCTPTTSTNRMITPMINTSMNVNVITPGTTPITTPITTPTEREKEKGKEAASRFYTADMEYAFPEGFRILEMDRRNPQVHAMMSKIEGVSESVRLNYFLPYSIYWLFSSSPMREVIRQAKQGSTNHQQQHSQHSQQQQQQQPKEINYMTSASPPAVPTKNLASLSPSIQPLCAAHQVTPLANDDRDEVDVMNDLIDKIEEEVMRSTHGYASDLFLAISEAFICSNLQNKYQQFGISLNDSKIDDE